MNTKVAIVGTGVAGIDLHLNAYRQIPEVEVVALCDLNVDRAREIAEQKNVPHAYASLEEALERQAVDIVSICTPPSSHFPLAKLAIEEGKHILVEKPIFETLEEAHQIQELLKRKGTKFSAGHNEKFTVGMQQALKLHRENYMGDVYQVHYTWMIHGSKNRMTRDPDFWCHNLPGGRWEETLPHAVYRSFGFMGPMRFVNLEMKQVTDDWPWLPADEVDITLEGEKGFVNIKLSANGNQYTHMLVYGSKRVLYIDHKRAIDLQEQIRYRPTLSDLISAYVNGLRNRVGVVQHETAHTRLIRDFVDYVAGKNSIAPVSWEEAINTLEVVYEIGQEIQTRWREKDARKNGQKSTV